MVFQSHHQTSRKYDQPGRDSMICNLISLGLGWRSVKEKCMFQTLIDALEAPKRHARGDYKNKTIINNIESSVREQMSNGLIEIEKHLFR